MIGLDSAIYCFGHDQHEFLIHQLLHIKQTSTIVEYIDRFTALVDQLHAYECRTDPLYYTMLFIDGLRHEIKSAIIVQHPQSRSACVRAQLQEEVVPVPIKKENRSMDFSASLRYQFKSAHPLSSPPSKWDEQPQSTVVEDKKPTEVPTHCR